LLMGYMKIKYCDLYKVEMLYDQEDISLSMPQFFNFLKINL